MRPFYSLLALILLKAGKVEVLVYDLCDNLKGVYFEKF